MLKQSTTEFKHETFAKTDVDKTTIHVRGNDSSVTEKCETKKTDAEKENHNMAT
jgi:hypothetical protein